MLAIAFVLMLAWQIVGWMTDTPAPLQVAAVVTDKIYEEVYGEEIIKRARELPKEVNILVVGLDNRVASTDNHADAIHLITIRTTDSIGATITSIPRGTEVKGYGIDDEFSFMANVRALKGRKTFMKAVSKLTRKKINYYVEVTFSQVMGVLELLGYKDPATALQFLRHRKSFPLGDVQRSHNQAAFIRSQMIRRSNLLEGAKGDVMIRMGLGMVDTDLDLLTAQALVYILRHNNVLDEAHIALDMRPRQGMSALLDIDIPEPDQMDSTVNKLVRKLGDEVDDLGRYDPYPQIRSIVDRAAQQSKPRAVIMVLEPVYKQKAWLQIQERPNRQDIRDRVEDMLVKAYTDSQQPLKAEEVRNYMTEERKAFSDVEREQRRFSYGRRAVKHHAAGSAVQPDSAARARARHDDIPQEHTPVESEMPSELSGSSASADTAHSSPPVIPAHSEPKVTNIDSGRSVKQ
jgi:anionic cell wall polymer biosynthesis LytR-Cps2A-Psr (LCP) family protein